MADTQKMLNFKMGELANLQALTTKTPGTIYVTTDERAMYLDVDINTRIRLGDAIITVNKVTELANVQPWQAGTMYYATEDDVLVIYTADGFKLVNEKLINQVSQIAQDLANTNVTVGTLVGTMGTVATKDTDGDGEADVITVGQWLAHLDSRTTTLEGEMDTAQADIDNAEAAIEQLQEEVASITGGGTDSIKTLKEAITALEGTTADHTTQISGLGGRLTTAETDIANLKSKDTALQGEIDAAEDRIKAIEDDYLKAADKSALERSITEVNTALNDEINRATEAEGALDTAVKAAQADADQALLDAAAAQSQADKGVADAAKAQEAADKAQDDVDALTGRVTAVENVATTNATNIATNAGNIATNTTNIATNAQGIANNLAAINAIKDHDTIDSFQDMVDYVATSIGANDAMKFMGTLGTGGTVTSLPADAQAGHTYKVITAGSYKGNDCKVGDLLIALVDNPTANSDWAYVPSGGEDFDNVVMSSDANSTAITLRDDTNNAQGTVTFVSGNDSLKVDGTTQDQIAISIVWGSF